MMRPLRRLSGSVAGVATTSLLFFVLYYLYLWLVVDLQLIYHGGGAILEFPVFYRGWEFFHRTTFSPGGFVNYLSAFFAQFFYIGWAGALVATAQAWLLWQCSGAILKMAVGRQLRLLCFVTPILLLILYARYIYPLSIAMGVLAAFGFVRSYMRTTSKTRLTDLLVFLVLSIILYVIAGGVYLLFAAACGIYELLLRRRLVLGVTFLLSAPIVAYIVSVSVFNVSVIDVFSELVLHAEKGDATTKMIKLTTVYTLYLLLPLTMVALGLVKLLSKVEVISHSRTETATESGEATEKSGQNTLGRFITWSSGEDAAIFAPLLAILAGVLVACFCHDARMKTVIAVDYYASNKMWSQVLEVSARYPSNKFVNHSVDRALYHTGRLADDMFMYEQQPTGLMPSPDPFNLPIRWKLLDTFIDLGQINMAEFYLVFCMDTYGEQPILLKQRALVNMAKGNLGTARVCLGALSKTLFDAGWAKKYLAKIDRDPNLSTDKEVQQLRSMMPAMDRDFKAINENTFLDLLAKNRRNRMAFEYLMGFYLLTGRLDKFVENLDRLDDFNYTRIPKAYEEAILLYSYMKKAKVELHGREISLESHERCNNFLNVYLGQYGANKALAFKELARDYGDSYFFYSVYGRSGIKK